MDDAFTLLRQAVDLLPEDAAAENGQTVGDVREDIGRQEWELVLACWLRTAGPDSRYALAGLGGLHPGDFPGRGAGRSQLSECRLVDVGEEPPGRGRGGDRAEHLALVPQRDQIRDRLIAVGEHHREIGGGPARIMPGAARS